MAERLKPLTLIGMTVRNLYRQPVRTLLTSLGVAVGVVAIVSFGAIAQGMWKTTGDAIHFSQGDMVVFKAGLALDILSSLDEKTTREALLADPEVKEAIPILVSVLPTGRMAFMLAIGLELSEIAKHGPHLIRGRLPENEDEAVLGAIAARTQHRDVEDVLAVGSRRLTIVGVYETGNVFFDGAVSIALSRMQEVAGRPGGVTSFQVSVTPGADVQRVADRIERDNPGLLAVASAEQYKKVDQGLEVANHSVWVISFLSLLIGSVIIANTMWMTVYERTREIGVLRAIGWSKSRIVSMIIIEASCVGLIAWVLGSILGIGLAELATRLPMAAQFMDPTYGATPFLMALGVSVCLSILGGSIPAWRAARISPVEALRYE